MREHQHTSIFLALGGNLGDPIAAFRRTRQKLGKHPAIKVCCSSPLYQTPPVGGPANQPDYLNAVLMLETTLEPDELLHLCQNLENAEGRERKERWGARTLDIDLLLYGSEQIRTSELEIPHPRMTERRFVLAPLVDIAAEGTHPASGFKWRELLNNLPPVKELKILNRNW